VPDALAVPCGQPAPGSATPTIGELALDSENSDDPSLPSFEGGTKRKDVAFLFKVSGCTLGADADVKVRAVGDESDAVSFSAPEPKGEVLVVAASVDPKAFDPGEHKPKLVVSSASHQIQSQSLKLTLKRKEPPTWPILLSLIAAAIGLFYAFELARQAAIDAYDKKKAESAGNSPPKKAAFVKLLVNRREGRDQREPKVKYGGIAAWLAVLVGAGAGAGAAFSTSYIKSATWSLDVISVVLLIVAVAAATAGGAAVGLTKAVTAHELPATPDDAEPRGDDAVVPAAG
jgi:hypothetical protein